MWIPTRFQQKQKEEKENKEKPNISDVQVHDSCVAQGLFLVLKIYVMYKSQPLDLKGHFR